MSYTQENRLIAIDTPLGKDVLLLREFQGHEGLSQLFRFELDLLSTDPEIQFKDIIGKRVTIRLAIGDETERYFNGFISRFVLTGSDTGLVNYRATMVPWLWFLTRTSDCRIFQNKTVPNIVQQIFKEMGFADVEVQLKGTYEPREYCVQYRETDFNFVSRLMEQYGIYYFFKHTKEKHTLVLGDTPGTHPEFSGQKKFPWLPQGSDVISDVLTTVYWEQSFRPGKYALSDYNFEAPSTSLSVEVKTTVEVGGNSKYEIYDYPGEYEKKAQGEQLAKIRIEEEEAQHFILSSTSTCRAFTSGFKFELEEYWRKDLNTVYVLTQVSHQATVGSTYSSGKSTEREADYSNTFSAIPYKIPYRPARLTPKPIIQGVQTARVVGTSGEIIWCDKYGRVKVQFFWDREGKWDDNSSCWIRTSQNWGGKGWGGVFVPHLGQEVIVSFLEGDPDRPIITGRVYNAEVMPPLALPAAAEQSIIQDHGGNKILMTGVEGSQQMQFYSPKHNTSITLGNSISLTSENDFKFNSLGSWINAITGKLDFKVGGDVLKLFMGYEHSTILGFTSKLIGGIKNEAVKGAEVKLNSGAKAEVIKGATFKHDKSTKYELTGGPYNEKAPTWRQQVKLARLMHDEYVHHSKGKASFKVGAEYAIQSKSLKANADDDYYVRAGALYHLKSDILEEEAETMKKKASEYLVKAAKCGIKAKTIFGDGVMTIDGK
jgi:type VI secretion system secreted protein VgrG